MLNASFDQLNGEFGFSLALTPLPTLESCDRELALIERSYAQYLGLTQALRLSEPRFMEQFRRMLLSKLRMAFENATGDIELWNKAAANPIDAQVRERRRGFKRRREALVRIQTAAGDLDTRVADLESQDARWRQLATNLRALTEGMRQAAQAAPERADDNGASPRVAQAPALALVPPPRSAAG